MRDPVITTRAKALRRLATPPERAVWHVLRAPPFDAFHFRRQVPFGPRYIADFASHRAKVIVEVDGHSHDSTEAADAARTRWFEAEGYRVIRIGNWQAMDRDQDLARLLESLLNPPPP